jgi:hypothetical protein
LRYWQKKIFVCSKISNCRAKCALDSLFASLLSPIRKESSPNIEKTAASCLRDSVLLLRIKKYPDHISTKTPLVCAASCRHYKNTRQMRQWVHEMAVSYEAPSQTMVHRAMP